MRYVINTTNGTKSNANGSRHFGNVLKGTRVDGLRMLHDARYLCAWLARQAAGLQLVHKYHLMPVPAGTGRSRSRLPGLLGGPESRSHVRMS